MIQPIPNQAQWNQFLEQLNPNTFLQSWQWGQIQQRDGETVHYLGLFDGTSQVGAALVILVKARRGYHYLIPHGPLLRQETEVDTYLTELIEYLKKRAPKDGVVALRIAPLMLDTPAIRSIFARHKFRAAPLHVHAELTWTLDITNPVDQLLQNMRKTTRHAIRKAEKIGVATEIFAGQGRTTAALTQFWPLYKQTKTRHQFVPFSKQLLLLQLQEFSQTNTIFTIIATYQTRPVAAAICVQFGSTVFYYHGASTKLPSSIPATQLLQWHAIQEAKRRGATRYNFWGIAPANQPHHPFTGITTFKKGFGGQAYNYLHAQDLPLSFRYLKLWLIETIRKYQRGF